MDKLYYLRFNEPNKRFYVSKVDSQFAVTHTTDAHEMRLFTEKKIMLFYGRGMLEKYDVFEVDLGREVTIKVEFVPKEPIQEDEEPIQSQGEVVIKE